MLALLVIPFQLDCGQHPLDPVSVQHEFMADKGVLDNWRQHASRALQAYLSAQALRLDRVNRNRVYPNFRVGQRVMLSSEYLKWHEKSVRGKKLTDRWIGDFEIESVSKNNQSVRLKFPPDSQWSFHPHVPVSRVKPYYQDTSGLRKDSVPPLPDLLDGAEYYEVSGIVAHRYNRRNKCYQFRVQFVGYDEASSQWLAESSLEETCSDLLREYKRTMEIL